MYFNVFEFKVRFPLFLTPGIKSVLKSLWMVWPKLFPFMYTKIKQGIFLDAESGIANFPPDCEISLPKLSSFRTLPVLKTSNNNVFIWVHVYAYNYCGSLVILNYLAKYLNYEFNKNFKNDIFFVFQRKFNAYIEKQEKFSLQGIPQEKVEEKKKKDITGESSLFLVLHFFYCPSNTLSKYCVFFLSCIFLTKLI